MCKHLKSNRGETNPLFIKIAIGVVCALILAFIGISTILDKQSEMEYQKWARDENQKVYDASRQTRITERQLLKLRRELNNSFYQRLENDLPVRILIVGDAYGNGYGANNKSAVWSKLLQTGLRKKFGVKVDVENVTLSGMNGCYSAWARLMSLPDGTAEDVLTAAGAVKNKEGAYTGEVLISSGDTKDSARSDAGEATPTGESVDSKSKTGTGTADAGDTKTAKPTPTGATIDARTVASSRETEYDLCIISLGMTDEPRMFELYYEGVLREVRRKFSKCSIISLLSNQALTAPELGYADDNYDAFYRISKHYDASVINVGLEITDPDAAAKGATMSQIPYGSITSESLAADMRSDGISERKVKEVAAKDLSERTAAAEEAIKKYTIDGLYLNNAGQKFLSERILHFIEQKVSKNTGYDAMEIAPLRKEAATLDQYHYFPVKELVRLDDYTYVLPENTVATMARGDGVHGPKSTVPNTSAAMAHGDGVSGPKSTAPADTPANTETPDKSKTGPVPTTIGTIVGVDYSLVKGDNDIYAATGGGHEGFGRIVRHHDGTGKEHFIWPLNEGYSCTRDGNLILAFATREQADTLHGVIIGGDFTLPSYFDGYQHVPYIGPTDENGNPVPLNRDGKPSDGEDQPDPAANTTDTTQKPDAANASPAASSGTPQKAAAANQNSAAQIGAFTFGNDQPAQGNAVAVAESLSDLTALNQTAEAADTSGAAHSGSEAADISGTTNTGSADASGLGNAAEESGAINSGSEATDTSGATNTGTAADTSDATNTGTAANTGTAVDTSDATNTAADTSGATNTGDTNEETDTSASENPSYPDGPVRPNDPAWSSYELGNLQNVLP